MDLVWMIAKSKYANFDNPTPSSLEFKTATKDTRTAEQIKKDLVKRLTERK